RGAPRDGRNVLLPERPLPALHGGPDEGPVANRRARAESAVGVGTRGSLAAGPPRGGKHVSPVPALSRGCDASARRGADRRAHRGAPHRGARRAAAYARDPGQDGDGAMTTSCAPATRADETAERAGRKGG